MASSHSADTAGSYWSDAERNILLRMSNNQIELERNDSRKMISWTQHWKQVSSSLHDNGYSRSAYACRGYFYRIQQNLGRAEQDDTATWSDDEHQMLVQMTNAQIDVEKVDQGAIISWTEHWGRVASQLKDHGHNRSTQECRMHWVQYENPSEESIVMTANGAVEMNQSRQGCDGLWWKAAEHKEFYKLLEPYVKSDKDTRGERKRSRVQIWPLISEKLRELGIDRSPEACMGHWYRTSLYKPGFQSISNLNFSLKATENSIPNRAASNSSGHFVDAAKHHATAKAKNQSFDIKSQSTAHQEFDLAPLQSLNLPIVAQSSLKGGSNTSIYDGPPSNETVAALSRSPPPAFRLSSYGLPIPTVRVTSFDGKAGNSKTLSDDRQKAEIAKDLTSMLPGSSGTSANISHLPKSTETMPRSNSEARLQISKPCFSDDQREVVQLSTKQNPIPSSKEKQQLSKRPNSHLEQVNNWFKRLPGSNKRKAPEKGLIHEENSSVTMSTNKRLRNYELGNPGGGLLHSSKAKQTSAVEGDIVRIEHKTAQEAARETGMDRFRPQPEIINPLSGKLIRKASERPQSKIPASGPAVGAQLAMNSYKMMAGEKFHSPNPSSTAQSIVSQRNFGKHGKNNEETDGSKDFITINPIEIIKGASDRNETSSIQGHFCGSSNKESEQMSTTATQTSNTISTAITGDHQRTIYLAETIQNLEIENKFLKLDKDALISSMKALEINIETTVHESGISWKVYAEKYEEHQKLLNELEEERDRALLNLNQKQEGFEKSLQDEIEKVTKIDAKITQNNKLTNLYQELLDLELQEK